MKSSLRTIRHLQAIPGLADPERGWEDSSPKGERIAEDRRRRGREASAEDAALLDPALEPYFLSRMHDARIESFRRDGDRFTITAYDEELAALAVHRFGLKWSEVRMPFDVVFEGTIYVGWRRIESDESLVFASAPRGPVEWVYDRFVDPQEPGVRWALEYYVSGTKRKDRNHLLLVEAGRVHVVERQRAEWRRRFGEEELEVFDRYRAMRAEVSLVRRSERLAEFGHAPSSGAGAS